MKENNPQAFPRAIEGMKYQGMTLRDYFAAKALSGILSDVESVRAMARDFNNCTRNRDSDIISDYVAQSAYEFADAMLKEREL